MPSPLECQMDMDWTPATAAVCASNVCTYLKDENINTWHQFAPQISAGLTCLADDPDEIYRLALHIVSDFTVGQKVLLGTLLASVNAELPERIAVQAITNGAMMPLLRNRSYPVKQRLAWIREYTEEIIPQGGLSIVHGGDLDAPIKNALMLWFYMEANKGMVPVFLWNQAGVTQDFVSTKQFLASTAPGVFDRIHLVQTLSLSYNDAFDMLIDEGEMVGLPDLTEDGLPGLETT